LGSFLKRHNFVLRRRTTTCQKPPLDFAEAVALFVVHLEKRRKAVNFAEIWDDDEDADLSEEEEETASISDFADDDDLFD
jgi:hypothetical protein